MKIKENLKQALLSVNHLREELKNSLVSRLFSALEKPANYLPEI